MTADVVVAGQLARDLVLVVEEMPKTEQSRPVRQRREMLGGSTARRGERGPRRCPGDGTAHRHRDRRARRRGPAAATILGRDPAVAALAVGDAGNYFAWRDPAWGPGN